MTCDPDTARQLQPFGPSSAGERLAIEVMTWMVPAGNVRFEEVPAPPRSTAEATED